MITTATATTALSVTTDGSSSLFILHLSPSLEERVHQLLLEIRNSSLFSEEEKEELVRGEIELQTNRDAALAYIQIHVIRSARESEYKKNCLPNEEELSILLQESLSAGGNAEDFIDDFEKKELEFERLCQKIKAVQRRRRELYEAANQVNAQIRAGGEELEHSFVSLQQGRIQAVDQMTNEISSIAAHLEKEAEKAKEIGRRTLEIAERMKKDQSKLNAVSAKAEAEAMLERTNDDGK